AARGCGQRREAALRLPLLERRFAERWTAEAIAVLPIKSTGEPGAEGGDGEGNGDRQPPEEAVWSTVVAWAALEALGRMQDPADPDHAAAALFDGLRPREPAAGGLGAPGPARAGRWRAAARVRASVAHAGRPRRVRGRPRAP